jgi:uncharacterized protein YifE (UPF0438 family)
MNEPLDHDTELARTGYPVPPGGDLTDGERTSLARYGYWMESLSRGRLKPKTDDQQHFVAVALGEAEPQTPFEWAWVKLQLALHPPKVLSPAEMSALAHRLERARDAALDAQLSHSEKRQKILDKVQAELNALDALEADCLQALDAEFSRLEAEFREALLLRGLSFNQGKIKGTYYHGRVSYDPKGMEAFARLHPEVNQYKKVGKAYVALKFVDDSGAKQAES